MNQFTQRARFWTALGAVTLLCALAPKQGMAQPPPTVGVYFDAEGTQTSRTVTSYPVDVDFYVVAKGLAEDIKSYELGLAYEVSHPSLFVSSYEIYPAGVNNLCEPEWFDLCVAANPCLPASGGRAVLARFTLFVHSPVEDYIICLGPTGEGHGPWFAACGGDTAEMLLAPYQGCAVLNPVGTEIPVGAEIQSWSRIKALYTPR